MYYKKFRCLWGVNFYDSDGKILLSSMKMDIPQFLKGDEDLKLETLTMMKEQRILGITSSRKQKRFSRHFNFDFIIGKKSTS